MFSSYFRSGHSSAADTHEEEIPGGSARLDATHLSVNGSSIALCSVHSVKLHRLQVQVIYYPPPQYKQRRVAFRLSSEEQAAAWFQRVQEAIGQRRTHLLVLVNPFGGKGQARKLWDKEVVPVLNTCTTNEISYDVIETSHAKHATSLAAGVALTKYDAIVTCSGDGLMYEVVQGLMKRIDWDQAIKTPLIYVPCGSGNAQAASLGCFTVESAAALICIGAARPLDVTRVTQGPYTYYSLVMLGWGIIADVDFESEKMRWMGGARFTVSGLQHILSLKMYSGRVKFIPDTEWDRRDAELCSVTDCTRCMFHGQQPGEEGKAVKGDTDNGGEKTTTSHPPPLNSNDPFDSHLTARYASGPASQWHADDERWVTQERDDIVALTAGNNRFISYDMMMHPLAHFSDGCIDLMTLGRAKKGKVLKVLLGLEKGTHIAEPEIEYVKVKALCVEPSPDQTGYLDVDGERLAMYSEALYAEVHRGLANIVAFRE